MKKRLFLLTCLMSIAVFVLSGCGEPTTDEKTGAPIVDIKADLPYELGTMKVYNDRTVSVQFENKTDLDIVSWEAEFVVKDKKLIDADKIKTRGTQNLYTEKGKKTSKMGLYSDKGKPISTTKDISKAVEPESLMIEYRYENKLYAAEYDYIGDDTVYENRDNYEFGIWDENKLTKDIPKPDSDKILVHQNDEKFYRANIYCNEKKEFEEYVKKLKKEKGKDVYETEDQYHYTAKTGVKVSTIYDSFFNRYLLAIDKE